MACKPCLRREKGLRAEEGEGERLKKTVGRLNQKPHFRGFNTELNTGADGAALSGYVK